GGWRRADAAGGGGGCRRRSLWYAPRVVVGPDRRDMRRRAKGRHVQHRLFVIRNSECGDRKLGRPQRGECLTGVVCPPEAAGTRAAAVARDVVAVEVRRDESGPGVVGRRQQASPAQGAERSPVVPGSE